MQDKGQNRDMRGGRQGGEPGDFVLDKSIFSNIFDKDIRRVYLYKKSERLAKAIHLIAPAFAGSPALRDRIEDIAIGLIDTAILPMPAAKEGLSQELLTLSSVLAIARSSGILSPMNADIISREAQSLLQEVATYEEPHLFLEDVPSLATLARDIHAQTGRPILGQLPAPVAPIERASPKASPQRPSQGQAQRSVSDKGMGRREAILAVLKAKGPSYIKDISMVVRGVSEKTVQRELQVLVEEGKVKRSGERRWTTYSLA